MNSRSYGASSELLIRRAMVRFKRSGGVLPDQANWPFVKLKVDSGRLNVKLFGTNLSLIPDNLAQLEEYSQAYAFGKLVKEHGIRMTLTDPVTTSEKLPPITNIDVSLRSKDFDNVIEALQIHGFKIVKA